MSRSGRTAFSGQAVLLTGASSGIGRALALALARQQARLVLTARDQARLESVSEQCRALGADSSFLPADLERFEDCHRVVQGAVERLGGLDMLILNAGLSMRARFDEVEDPSIFERLIRVNYLANVHLTRHALPALVRSKGRLVVVSSLTGLIGVPTRTGYAASKHALMGLFDSLRIEMRGSGLSVTVVAPDFVVSDLQRRALGADGQSRGTTHLDESRILTAEACAARILQAAARRRRLAVLSFRGRIIRLLSLVLPGLVDSLTARATTGRPEHGRSAGVDGDTPGR